jgi:hypothetical protein
VVAGCRGQNRGRAWRGWIGVRVGGEDGGGEEVGGVGWVEAAAADVGGCAFEEVVQDADEPGCWQVGAEDAVGLAAADEFLDSLGWLGVELADPPGG